MGRYQAYPEYGDTGVGWIGAAPRGWEVIPVGRLFWRTKRTNFVEKELLSVYRDYGVIPTSSRDDNNNKPSEDLAPYQLVEPADLVMNKMKAWQGSIAISEFEGIVSPAYFVYRPNKKMFQVAESKYIHYLLRHPMYIAQYMRQSKGIRVNQWDLDPEEFQRIELLLPSKPEQIEIINFLDHETAKIDTLIEKQQQLIQLLKEKRQAVISHAVTKGLNPDAPMKDSGVEWLGEVPEAWDVCRVKQITNFITSGPRGWSDFLNENGEDLFLQSGDLNYKLGLELTDAKKVTPPNNAEGVRTKLESGDVVVCITGANTGRVAITPELVDTVYINQHLSLVRPIKSLMDSDYLGLVLSSSSVKSYFSVTQYGLKEGLSLSNVGEAPVCRPPLKEQKEIVQYVRNASDKYDALESCAEKQVELLRERRTALISTAVTGKIDVRHFVSEDGQASKVSGNQKKEIA